MIITLENKGEVRADTETETGNGKLLGEQDQKPEVMNLQIMRIFPGGEGTEVGSMVSSRSCLSRVCLEMRAGWAAHDNSMHLASCVFSVCVF